MTNVINRWIQTKLGIIMSWNAETFCDNTRDGHLLSRLLRSYEIISDDQLGMIHKTSVRTECLENFQHITRWIETLGISLLDDEVHEIVDYTGLGSINIFYKLYLELHEKDNLTFITKRRLTEKLHPQNARFSVKGVGSVPSSVKVEGKYESPWVKSYDVIHWHQDRLEMLVNKCKSAREEYMSMVRMREKRLSSSFSFLSKAPPDSPQSKETVSPFNESAKSVDFSYEELIQEQRRAKQLRPLDPNPEEAKITLKKYKAKAKKKAESVIFQKEIHTEVLNLFWDKIQDEEDEDCDKDIIEKLLKQSLYEKQMLMKLSEVKFQKEVMIQNKLAISDAISKQNEEEFVEKWLDEHKELNEKELQYYLNKEHALKLHKKIYEEKLRLKSERLHKMCSEIISDICDIACKESEYKDIFGEVPSEKAIDNWKKCLSSNEGLDDAISPIETILKPTEEIPEDLETIVHYEIERQDKLDKRDFESYLEFEWPWELENVDADENGIREMNCGMNILGYIVHRLLKSKYPLHEPPPPPDLPKVKVSVCVNGLRETSCLPLLQRMLDHQDILVLEMQDVVNFCINAFKEEVEQEDADDLEKTHRQITEDRSKKKHRKGAKSKSKIDERTKADGEGENTFQLDKKVQTPKVYPCEGISFSAKAELGRIAEEELSRGCSLTDHLLVHMFLEFLRPKRNLKGWVLVNYPVTLEQAILLEESLTGVKVPGFSDTLKLSRSIGDLAEIEITKDANVDAFEKFRSSRLLKNPVKELENQLSYDSALTAFIKIIQTPTPDNRSDYNASPENVENPENAITPLEIFYSDMGCNYSLYYEHFDYYTIKSLGKLIIGDYSIPPKTSIELFGDTIRYIDAEEIVLETIFKSRSVKSMKKGDKKEQKITEKVIKGKLIEEETKTAETPQPSGKKKKGKLGKAGHVLIVHEDKFTQIPEVVIEEIGEEEEEKALIEPGGPVWRYIDLKLSDDLQVPLATFWENAEEVYIGDFSQVMFMNRIILNAIIPKVNYIKHHMHMYINSPDDKQMYLRKFQQIYNEFDADVRSDVEFKFELHCRVNELREKLIGVCDQQMAEAEQARCFIISRKWCPRQIVELINNYINGFQLEIDLHVDTIILVSDYYTGIVTKLPVQESLAKETLARLDLLDAAIEESVCDVLIRVDEDLGDPCHDNVEQVYDKALAVSNKCQSWAWSCLEKVKALFSPPIEKAKEKQSKKNKGGKGEKSRTTVFEPGYDVKKHSERLFEEWTAVLTGEFARLLIRLKLLKFDMKHNLQQTLSTLKSCMSNIFQAIRSKYRHELEVVNNVCDFLARAVEAEVPLQEELVFRDGEFFLNAQNIFFPDELAAEPSPSDVSEGTFSILQLETMADILFDLAPSGCIPERTFVYLLQDMVMRQERDMAPVSWSRMTPENVTQLSERLFGRQELISWKDFIVYNFMVPFPSAEDVLRLRREYRAFDVDSTEVIHEDQYYSVDLWFEGDSRANLIKRLIFEMYKVSKDHFNYTAMLFQFCKADDTPAGIAKALTLSSGRDICSDNEMGDRFMRYTLERRRIHEEEVRIRNEERRQTQKFSESIVLHLVDQVIHQCDSVIIEDLASTEVETSRPSLQKVRTSDAMKMKSRTEDVSEVEEESYIETTEENQNIAENEEESCKVVRFSNLEIGFENCDHTDLTYFITIDHLKTVLINTLPSISTEKLKEGFSEELETIFEECKDAQFNNEVFSHVILNNNKFLDLMSQSFNFQIENPPKIVAELLEANENTHI